MIERQPSQPSVLPRTIEGASATILFDAYPELLNKTADRTNNRHISHLQIDNEDDLPFPANSLRLSSWWRDEGDTLPEMSGDIAFSAEDIQETPHAWPFVLLDEVTERLAAYGAAPQRLNHDPLSIYVPVDRERFLRLEFYSGPDCCGVAFTTTYSEDSYQILEPRDIDELNSADVVLHAAEILSLVLDALHHKYDDEDTDPTPCVLDASLGWLDEEATANEETEQERPAETQIIEEGATPVTAVGLGTRALEVYRFPVNGPSPEELAAKSQLTLDQIGGFFAAKEQLQGIAEIFEELEIAARYHIAPNNFIVYGPSGVDNRQLIEGFAGTIGATLIPVHSTDVIDKMIGDSGKKLETIFKKATDATERQVIYIESLDTLLRGGNNTSSVYEDITATFIRVLENIYEKYPHVVVAASTTRDTQFLPHELANDRRFMQISAPTPDKRDRSDMWVALLGAKRSELDAAWVDGQHQADFVNPIADEYDYAQIIELSSGMDGRHLRSAIDAALFASFLEHKRTRKPQQITQAQLEQAIKQQRV